MKKLLIISLFLLSEVSMASNETERGSCKPSVKVGLLGGVLGLSGLMLTACAITENSYDSGGDSCNTPQMRADKDSMGLFGICLLFGSGMTVCHAFHINKHEKHEEQESQSLMNCNRTELEELKDGLA